MPKRKQSSHKNEQARQDPSGTFVPTALSRGGGGPPVLKPGIQNPYAAPAICVFLLLAVGFVFGQTLRHDFVNYDDNYYVYENPQVAHGLTVEGIAWAFTANHSSNWHPLTWLSHMLDCQLYGLKPWGHHLTNVLLHAATAILLFLALRRMTGDLWPSALVAAVFAIHPLRVESVAWVAERKDVLSGLFFMLTLWAYIGYVRHPFSLVRYLTVMVLFALGLMSKPMLVTLPFVLLLLDYWPLGRMAPGADGRNKRWATVQLSPQRGFSIPLRLVMEKVPLLMLAAASCVATLWAQREAISFNEYITLSLRISNAVVSYVAYMGQMFYPAGLAVLYLHPEHGLPMWKVMGALLLLLAICGGVVALRRRCPYLLVGWLWYVGMLVPVIGLVQVGLQAMADRYTYLTQIGLYIAIAWGVAQVSGSWRYGRRVCGIASALVLMILMGCAWRQTSFWRDSETLWNRTLACTSQNYLANYNLGVALNKLDRVREVIEQYQQTLRIKPDYYQAHLNLGAALSKVGRPEEAVEHYRRALQLNPNLPDAHYNLGNTSLMAGRLQEAIDYYEQALRLRPDYFEAYNNLGAALVQAGRPEEAIKYLMRAIEIRSDHLDAHYNLAIIYSKTNRPALAIATARKAIDIARSQGLTDAARQIEDWLNSYQAQETKGEGGGK